MNFDRILLELDSKNTFRWKGFLKSFGEIFDVFEYRSNPGVFTIRNDNDSRNKRKRENPVQTYENVKRERDASITVDHR